MQVVSKIELPTSPSYSSLSSPLLTPKSSKELMQSIIKLLHEGQESAQHIRSFLNEQLVLKNEDNQANNIDHHFLMVLSSFKEALCIAKNFNFDQEDVMKKRKFDRTNNIFESVDHCKSEDSGRSTVSKEKRGCYKRRRTGQTRTLEGTDLVDDGYAWRKYGQKEILNTKFPRNYYRCTHKHDQECQAIKQVQQISENPTKYNIIYIGTHTCKNLHKTTSIIIDPTEQNSSLYLCFETKNYPTVKTPQSILHTTPNMAQQEYTSIKKEVPISTYVPLDIDHISRTHSNNMQCSSSSENLPSSSDITSNTPVSDQGDSFDYGLHDDGYLANFMMNMDDNDIYFDEFMNYPIN